MERKPHEHNNFAVQANDFLFFSTKSGNCYLFDANTSSVHPWQWPVSANDIDDLYRLPNSDFVAHAASGISIDLLRYVRAWQDSAGAFQSRSGHDFCASNSCSYCNTSISATERTPPIWEVSPSVFSNLLLVVTNACNLRCKYCLFSGSYEGYRTYSAHKMNFETAKASVNNFFVLNDSDVFKSIPDRKLDIAFFGGEPLLHSDLIKDVVLYAKKEKRDHYDLHFSMTTNLTHLPKDMAEFCIAHAIELDCSIDGPPEVHDKDRITARGDGSSKKLKDNLHTLYDMDKEYFKEKVRAVVTLSTHSKLLEIYRYFDDGDGDPLVPPIAFVGFVRNGNKKHQHARLPSQFSSDYKKLIDIYIEKKRTGAPVDSQSFLYQFIEFPLRILHDRLMSQGSAPRSSYTGTCQPGRRIAVATDGKFHLCERINENFPIGTAVAGLDFDQITNLMQEYYRALPNCDQCWARGICIICCAEVCTTNGFEFSSQHCSNTRDTLAQQMRLLYTLLEICPDALDVGDPIIDHHYHERSIF